jgi:hypothetical protein
MHEDSAQPHFGANVSEASDAKFYVTGLEECKP